MRGVHTPYQVAGSRLLSSSDAVEMVEVFYEDDG